MTEKNRTISIPLHKYELWLIEKIRKYRYGELTVIFSDGIPIKIRKTIINETPQNDEVKI